jgi:hypothetical protein
MSNPDPILPIVLTVTVYPPKKNVRKVVVTGAPQGEMPLLLTGAFQERHALLDQAYAQCLKRDPQLVTVAEAKPTKASKTKSITAGADDEDAPEEDTPANQYEKDDYGGPSQIGPDGEEDTDQLVTDAAVPVSPITEAENLPAIEGDDAPSKELDARLQPASIAVGEMSTLEEQILEWKEEDHGQQD